MSYNISTTSNTDTTNANTVPTKAEADVDQHVGAAKETIKGQYIVMDNAPIHKPKVIKALIKERGHKCIYLPAYSPFLNPIEEFWSKIKAGVRRTPSTADDRLTDRICDSAGKVTKKDCEGWIKHSISFFQK